MEWIKLTDICRPKQWKTIAGKDLLTDGYPVYGANGLIGYWTEYNHEYETITIACRGTCGKVNIVPGQSYINGNAMCMDDLSDRFSLKFLYYYLKRYDFKDVITGTTIPQITIEGLQKVIVPCLSLVEQEEIVRCLSRVETIVQLRQHQLVTLDDLIKARFVEMFGDCRLNPRGWKTVALGDTPEVGSSKRVFVEELKETGIPFFKGTEVGALAEGKIITPELFITEEHYSELIKATGKPKTGDLLMPSICPDGRIWVVDTDKPFYFKDGRVLWVHGVDKRFNPVFLLYTLKDRIMTDYGSIASGTTFAELKIFALKHCQVFDVPIEDQMGFAAFVTQVDKSKVVGMKKTKRDSKRGISKKGRDQWKHIWFILMKLVMMERIHYQANSLF